MDIKIFYTIIIISILYDARSEQKQGCTMTYINSDMYKTCTGRIHCNEMLYYQFVYYFIHKWTCLGNTHKQYTEAIKKNYDIYLEINNITINNYNTMLLNHESTILPREIPIRNIKKIAITNSVIYEVPYQVYELPNVIDIKISDNDISAIKLLRFVNNKRLNAINASNNRITELDEDMTYVIQSKNYNIVNLIDLSNNAILKIPDNYFQVFSNLLHLNLSHNHIKSLDLLTFEGLSKLETLHLSNNELKHIEHTLMRFYNLRELSLDNNKITAILETNFKVMSKLVKLNLCTNLITDIEDTAFQNLRELSILDLSNNRISFLKNKLLENNNKLKFVNVSQNTLMAIQIEIPNIKNIQQFYTNKSNITEVIDSNTFQGIFGTKLDLSNNKISSISSLSFNKCKVQFTSLNLSRNNLSIISLDAFASLKTLVDLDLSHNYINNIDFDISFLDKLTYLNLSCNRIEKITKFTFKNLLSLKKLDLSQNAIAEIEKESFDDLLMLEALFLNNNLFSNSLTSDIFQNLGALKYLNIMNTRSIIYENNTFSSMTNLKILNSSHCELSTLEYNALANTDSIEFLDLSHNFLQSFHVDPASLANIKELYLNDNKIKIIAKDTFNGIKYINKIFLENNNIQSLDSKSLISLNKLSHIYLAYNEELELNGTEFDNVTPLIHVSLKSVKKPFHFQYSKNTTILSLDLSFCNIIHIHSLFINKILKLSHLNLSSNKVTYINKHSFQNMPHLKSLDLSNNLITDIEPRSFVQTKMIRLLNLHGNDISLLQYGVLDDLENIRELNLSSNSLQSFEVNLLHNNPLISIISLNDNIIENINVVDFMVTNVKKLSLGGNIISCNVFVQLKTQDMGKLQVTTDTLDYHSENVNGITCKTNNFKSNYQVSNNKIQGNVNLAVDSLSNTMEMLRDNIQRFGDVDKTQKNVEDILKSINKFINMYNEFQTVTNYYMKQLMRKNNGEIIVEDHVKTDNHEAKNNNILICIILLSIITGLCCYCMYSYYKWRNFKYTQNAVHFRNYGAEIENTYDFSITS